jgi:hypothetical protein
MKEQLLELMQNSADNGQPVWDWEPETVAWEIQAYVDGFTDVDAQVMTNIIKQIQEEMGR